MTLPLLLALLILAVQSTPPAGAATVDHVSQYGITWSFDAPREAGQFINGDWWVVGPVKIVSVSPAPGPAQPDEPAITASSRYGASALRDDRRMRNGSMLQPAPSPEQGYDSRLDNYDAGKSASFPLELEPNETLVSTISETAAAPDRNGVMQLSTPFILGEEGFALCPPRLPLALQAAAVLTCLGSAPPQDAFRPPYCSGRKPIYRERDLRWDLLPRLASPPDTPSWAAMERIFARPWLDHDTSWYIQYTGPGENQPNYGREFARMTSIGALMLLLDVPQAQKRTLLIEYVQLGVDLAGLAQSGRNWYSDGGHWQGRKWPILFASLMLGDAHLRDFPAVNPGAPIYGRIRLDPASGPTTTLFEEDQDTYYGAGGDGQSVLWQIVFHTGPRAPYQEHPRSEFDAVDKFVDGYQMNNASSWIGTALAALAMKAKSVWGHDAYFDYVDQWMSRSVPYDFPKWLPKTCRRGVDPFVETMWDRYRSSMPAQPSAGRSERWVYTDGSATGGRFSARTGMWTPNPRRSPQ